MTTLKRLPPEVDPRGPNEHVALMRADELRRGRNVVRAWEERQARLHPKPAPAPKNVIYFGSAAK